MALNLQVIHKPENIVLVNEFKKFVEQGGSIGRADHCDLQLIDDSNHISKIHALIHFRDDMYFITDVSTNGVFVNGETVPIGKGNTKQILQGEKIQIGGYVIQASLGDTADKLTTADSTAPINSEVDLLLNTNEDISDLLNIEKAAEGNIVRNNDELSIDDLLATLDNTSNEQAAKLAAIVDQDDPIADLLGINDPKSTTEVNELNSNDQHSILLATIYHQLDSYSNLHPEHTDIVTQIKHYLEQVND